ncbi:MAG: hypothetical protein JNL39_02855, partial [Opitutaceae bacterium]|nr:hypothetical protein [Opitutaceae bacterium]
MTASPRLKCFIASAFGFEDVDRVYDRVVRRVLREQGVKALRVDRVEHNEDIDNQIFHLLNASQLCIADLTHARPSVYYEAGYATGKEKPVIYIVRSDHFRRRSNAEDPHGNLRVHFDLQMKNVISWDGSLVDFEKRLIRRLKLVLRFLKRPATADAEKRERDEFAKCSIHERQQRLEVIAKRALRRA